MTKSLNALLDDLAAYLATPDDACLTLPREAYLSKELYELEVKEIFERSWLCVGRDEYIDEGLGLMILGRNDVIEPCYVDDTGIHKRLCDSYGLTPDGNQGPRASELLGLRQKPDW